MLHRMTFMWMPRESEESLNQWLLYHAIYCSIDRSNRLHQLITFNNTPTLASAGFEYVLDNSYALTRWYNFIVRFQIARSNSGFSISVVEQMGLHYYIHWTTMTSRLPWARGPYFWEHIKCEKIGILPHRVSQLFKQSPSHTCIKYT